MTSEDPEEAESGCRCFPQGRLSHSQDRTWKQPACDGVVWPEVAYPLPIALADNADRFLFWLASTAAPRE